MVVIISFRKKKLKISYSLVVILVLALFNLCLINYFDSSSNKKNYITSITNLATMGSDESDEDKTDLQSKIVAWGEVVANNSNLSNLDNIISYPDTALVKVREDNKIEFIVKRDTMEFSSQTRELLSEYNAEFYEEISYFNASIIYILLDSLEKFIAESRVTPGIAYVEPNFYFQLDFVPNDEYYASDQWSLPLIGMESAWDYELGSHDILVAVVDTGIDYTHPDLSENYLPLGYDWVNDDDDPMDDYYHGTHCAGTIAALIDNTEGVAGMANVSIFAEKSFNSAGSGSQTDSILALKHAVDMGADIISCSWGGTSYSDTMKEAIDYAVNHDVMVIAAAGNRNTFLPHYPAAYPGVIAVSATDQNDDKASFSNYGEWIDVSAPGVSIISTVPYYLKGTYYSPASGTSMATPHVSGLAALLMSAFPAMNADQIENLIYSSAKDLGNPGFDQYYGYGRIDATNIFGPDITPPSYSNLAESADPLLLGNTEIITIDVSDPSGVNQVLIEFNGLNHTMANIHGNTWRYDSWTPSNTGIYSYTIFMEDNVNLWNSVSDSIEVKEDTEPPLYSDLQESADPLELGSAEMITISITDLSGINQVDIEFEGSNHSMTSIGGDKWQYESWTPSNTGIYPYTIYMEDYYDHWNFVSGSIEVIDTTPPTFENLINNTSPLELGNSKTILVKTTDISGINQVLIKYEEITDDMIYLGGDVWQYKDFTPSKIGICEYTIYMEDNNKNWALIHDSIEVRDTITPYAPILITYPRGEVSGKIIFDWEDGNDPSGILHYRLIIDNESYPFITPGNIFEIEIENTGSESSYYELKESLPLGAYYFFLYQIDGVGHQSTSATGTFTVISPSDNQGTINLTSLVFSLFIIGSIVAVPSYVAGKKKKNGKSKIFDTNFEIKYLKSEIKDLMNKKKQTEKAAEIAVKYGNYAKAAELYDECEVISNQIFKKGALAEAESTKHYANMKSKAFQARKYKASFTTFSINDLISKYCNNIGIEYHCYPQIDLDGKKTINGWILNDTKFLQHLLTNPRNGLKLVRELGLYPENLTHITATNFIYTYDLSYQSIIDNCQKYQDPNVFIFIVGLAWPSQFSDRQSFAPPEDKRIIYRDNIRIIHINLFADLIGLEGRYRDLFFQIFKS